jgi:hypothetical protein
MTELVTRLNTLHECAAQKLKKAKERAKAYYDQKAHPVEIKIGDSVWLASGPKPHKFDDQYSGPYLVLETWDNGNVKIQISERRSKIVHSNRLRISHVQPADIPINQQTDASS